jgi:hypothetical protein
LPQVSRRPVIGSGAMPRSRHFHVDPELRHRGEAVALQTAPARGGEFRHGRYATSRKPATRTNVLRDLIEQNLLLISGVLLAVGSLGWGLALYDQLHSSGLFGPQSVYSTPGDADAIAAKTDSVGASIYVRGDPAAASFAARHDMTASLGNPARQPAASDGESAASVVAKEWSFFQPAREAQRPQLPAEAAAPKAPTRVASIDRSAPNQRTTPQTAPISPVAPIAVPRLPATTEPKTTLADFATAPFPYHGMLPGSDRPFLTTGSQEHRGHVNFRGRVLWEAQTFGDDHVLLHIPAGFDPKRPAVMVVFFHGHGATLARDVRDRQRLPDQISAAGTNAVLVAPQFAYDAADSSAGKFWEPDGFKRFLDEAARKLAALYGDPRGTAAFANMPIVIVSYSGGFGPTLSVLARGGVGSRIRGLVLLDSLYAGVDEFADWIADNRSAFFVSSYTPYTAHHNADLEHALAERSVPYGSELRPNHLQGMVTFLPAGDVPHRDFVTHAWADNPVEDVLLRMDDLSPKVETATASRRN